MTAVLVAAAGIALAVFLIQRAMHHDHIARAIRETGIEPDPRPQDACMVLVCHKTWVLSIDGWRTCAEHGKTQGLRSEGRESVTDFLDLTAWEQQIARGEGA